MSGWDCHAHLFGPYAKFPLAPDRSYTPPEATRDRYLAHLARLGLSNGVLVHPSAYGDDYSLLLDALGACAQLRGVIVTNRASVAQLEAWRAQGVRAARFSHRSGAGANFAGSASLDDLRRMAPLLAEAGLHAELWTDCRALPEVVSSLDGTPVPVVIDHMGGFDVQASVDDPGFKALLRWLERGGAWVKLCAYRNLPGDTDPQAGLPFHRLLLEANPRQLVWGSDWPHLRVDPAPSADALLAMFRLWTSDASLEHAILVDNPARLYA
ncbi:MAG TPA: amidohydrolase family protein [Ramlibacter sp.]|uniref:amidohydrolase family protein n=1 Tax=Ramlibacter sp. TaxID=1917967 RepID=UPI002D1AF5D9|nr:amidohydrolase family protein [Ramlibacter sp.]HVZ44004.1 amidohydrolase family protein [Ramlibacter sp.]